MSQTKFRFDAWTTDDGLPQNSVTSIAQTSEGYIWFATLDGLARFDGVRFKIFNKSNSPGIASNRMVWVCADARDTLWITTENNGLIRYRNGEFRTFTNADGLTGNDALTVQKDFDGSLLVTLASGEMRIRNDQFQIESRRSTKMQRVYLSASGTRWEMNKDGLFAIGGENRQSKQFPLPFEPIQTAFNEPFNFFTQTRLFEDDAGALWIAALGKLYRLQNGEYRVFTESDGMPKSQVFSIAQDGAGDVWLASEKDGACRLSDSRVVCYNSPDGLSSNEVRSFLLDREKTLWVGTTNAGINRVSRQVIASLSEKQGLAGKNVYPILEDSRGDVWIGTFSGLAKFSKNEITNFGRGKFLLYEIVQSLFEDRDGKIWVGSIGGVQRLGADGAVDFTEKFGFEIGVCDFWDIHQTLDGALWFATNEGVIRYQNDRVRIYTVADGLPAKDVRAIHEAGDGSLWFGTIGGVVRLKDEGFQVLTEQDGLAGNYIRSIYEDETGALWFGTYESGLSRLKNGEFVKITQQNGLFSNGVFQILPDARGNLWMSSNQGIYRVSKQQLDDFADGKIQSIVSTAFNKSDGMLNTECNGGRQPAGIRAADGKLWFPTQDGVVIVDPEAVRFNSLAPPVVIEEIKIENQPLFNFADLIELQPGQENLEINYTGLSFVKPEQIRFRYKLEGLDDDWTQAGTRRAAFYPYLPPGDYVFRVAAANSDNVWNEQGATIKITVHPPFYRTWLFFVISSAAIVFVAFGVYRARIATLRRAHRAQEEFARRLINAHETERRRIAAELHDSIGQSLAMIKNRAVFGAHLVEDEKAKEQLELITEQTSQTIHEVREISYNLRPYLLDRLGLAKAVKSLVNKIADTHHLIVEAEIDDVDDLFSSEQEMSVYRILQESLSNVVKHAQATEVRVEMKNQAGVLKIKISDDGKGFDTAAPQADGDASKGGFGLLGISERVRMLGGWHEIKSEPGAGTNILIKIPVLTGGRETNNGQLN